MAEGGRQRQWGQAAGGVVCVVPLSPPTRRLLHRTSHATIQPAMPNVQRCGRQVGWRTGGGIWTAVPEKARE